MKQTNETNNITPRESDAINKYFADINKKDLISGIKEKELVARIQQGDKNALDELVEANLKFVVSMAKPYYNKSLSLPDTIQNGNIGLIKAAKKYEDKGYKFISYAVRRIRQSILKELEKTGRIIKIGINNEQLIHKANKINEKFFNEHGYMPPAFKVAEELGVTEKKLINLLSLKNPIKLENPLTSDDSEYSLLNTIESNEFPSPDAGLLYESLQTNINELLTVLSDREAKIVTLYYGLNNTRTHSRGEIGEIFGMAEGNVRNILRKVTDKLRQALKEKGKKDL